MRTIIILLAGLLGGLQAKGARTVPPLPPPGAAAAVSHARRAGTATPAVPAGQRSAAGASLRALTHQTFQSALIDLTRLPQDGHALLTTRLRDADGRTIVYQWYIGRTSHFGTTPISDGVRQWFVPVRMTAPEVISANIWRAFRETPFRPQVIVSTRLQATPRGAAALKWLHYGREQGNVVRLRNHRLYVNGAPIFVIRFFYEHSIRLDTGREAKLVSLYDHMRDDLAANTVDIPWQANWNPRRHAYDFDGSRRQLQLAYSRGLFAMPDLQMIPANASFNPALHRMVGADGRQHPWADSFCAPAVLSAQTAYLSQVVQAFKANPATLGWYTGDEYAWPSGNYQLYSYDSSCQRSFVSWLKHKYGSLPSLNQAWQRSYTSWLAVKSPKSKAFDLRFADWQHFRRSVLRDYFHKLYVSIHQVDPDHPVWPTLYTYLSSHNNWGVNWRSLSSWWDLVPEVDVVTRGIGSDSNDSRGALLDQIAMDDGKAVVQTMHVWGSNYTKDQTLPSTVAQVFHGSFAGISYWAFGGRHVALNQSLFDRQTMQPNQPWYRYVAQTDRLLTQLAPSLQHLRMPPAPVGILITDLSSLYGVNLAPMAGVTALFRDLQIPVRFISERNLPELAQCRMLVVGDEARVWPTGLSAVIRAYLSQGGRLLVNGRPALRDGENRRLQGARRQAIQRLLGARPRTVAGRKKHKHIWVSDQSKILRLSFSLDSYTSSAAPVLSSSLKKLRFLIRKFLQADGIVPMVQFVPDTPVEGLIVNSEQTEGANQFASPTLQVQYLVGRSSEIVALMNYFGYPVEGRLKLRLPAGRYHVSPFPGKTTTLYTAKQLAKGIPERIAGYDADLIRVAMRN